MTDLLHELQCVVYDNIVLDIGCFCATQFCMNDKNTKDTEMKTNVKNNIFNILSHCYTTIKVIY